MTRCFAVLALLLSAGAFADEDWLESQTMSGSSVTFTTTLNPGADYYVTCSAGGQYRTCAASGSCTADATKDFDLQAGLPMLFVPRNGRTRLAVIAASGTCRLHDSIPRLTTINRQ